MAWKAAARGSPPETEKEINGNRKSKTETIPALLFLFFE